MVTEVSESDQRAYRRLYDSLGTTQRRTLSRYFFFDVLSDLGHRYRIYCDGDYMGNIARIKNHRVLQFYCAHINDDYIDWSVYDHYLAQALTLSTDEVGFLNVAEHA